MFLIFTDGLLVFKQTTIFEDDKQNAEDGYCEIVRLSDMKRYVSEDVWEDIEER